ncbi:MAG: hypothetical protein FWG56_12075 [Desulfovibrionaceae bacterium]|nr:hypothetical protein [Desulfovibrionaceae bacterium]
MHDDPNRRRTEKVTVRLDKYEHQLLVSLAEYHGERASTMLRAMLMREAKLVQDESQAVMDSRRAKLSD